MFETVLYGLVFFPDNTVDSIYSFGYKKKRNGKSCFWIGTNAAVAICMLRIIFKEINYFAAVIVFLLADEIGQSNGWQLVLRILQTI